MEESTKEKRNKRRYFKRGTKGRDAKAKAMSGE